MSDAAGRPGDEAGVGQDATHGRPELPEWLEPVREGAERISVHDLTRFMPPEDFDGRTGAVLVLFGEGPAGPDLLLIERSHHMRSHPGQLAFPGGGADPGETAVEAALREAVEETGLDAGGVEVFGTLPELWLPPSNYAVTPVLGWWREESVVAAVDPDEVHAVYRVTVDALLEPSRRLMVRHPRHPGWTSPAFLVGDDELLLWGFTAGIITNLFEFVGWTRDWDTSVVRDVPDRMVQGYRAAPVVRPNTRFEENR